MLTYALSFYRIKQYTPKRRAYVRPEIHLSVFPYSSEIVRAMKIYSRDGHILLELYPENLEKFGHFNAKI